MSVKSGSPPFTSKQKVAERDIWKKRKWAEKIIEKLKDGPAYVRDFLDVKIPQRSLSRTLKALQDDEMIQQKADGKYVLPGYENGTPNNGDRARISSKYLNDYLSWGWRFEAELNKDKVVVEYRTVLPWQRDIDINP